MVAIEGPKHAECIHQSCIFENFLESVQYNTKHCGINDDMDHEHSV